MRSLAVIVFIAIVGATGIYFANRPTVARGRVLAADLVQTNPLVKSLDCDNEIPIGQNGARFTCRTEFKNGDSATYTFVYDREGRINAVDQRDKQSAPPKIKKTADPWGD
jgi:hypothetical protein